jgi:hypothetical protein
VRDLTRDSRWSTYDVSVLKLSNVSFRGKCARMGNILKIPSPTKLARLGHFSPASQAGRLAAGCRPGVLCIYLFSVKHFATKGSTPAALVVWFGYVVRYVRGWRGRVCFFTHIDYYMSKRLQVRGVGEKTQRNCIYTWITTVSVPSSELSPPSPSRASECSPSLDQKGESNTLMLLRG